MALIGTNMSVAVQQTLAAATVVSAITKANPGVATSTAHGLSDGDVGVWVVSAGMVELDGQISRVASSATNAFSLEGIDTSNYSTYTAGNFYKITAWQTLAMAQSVAMPNPAPAKIDITRLIDKVKQYAYGLPDAPDGSITGLLDIGATAVGLVTTATNTNARMACRISWAGGQKTYFNALWSGGAGFDLATNDKATQTIAFTPVALVIHYSS